MPQPRLITRYAKRKGQKILLTSRGPFLTSAIIRDPKLKEIVVTLYPTFIRLRQVRNSRGYDADYSKIYGWAARNAADQQRKERKEARKKKNVS